MKATAVCSSMAIVMGTFVLLWTTAAAAPLESDFEQSENTIPTHPDSNDLLDLPGPWDAINTAALHKLLMQLDTEERMGRVSRSWPQAEPRGWGPRSVYGRLLRTDKRQGRYRQCYFNPISCFRK